MEIILILRETADENIKLYLKYCLFINQPKLTETIFEVSEIILSVQSWLRSKDFTEQYIYMIYTVSKISY